MRLTEQIAFYEQLTEDPARLKTRRELFSEPDLLPLIDFQIAAKGEERALALTRMRALLRGEEPLLGRLRRIESVPAIGFLSAVSLAVRMPALGSIDRQSPWAEPACHGRRHKVDVGARRNWTLRARPGAVEPRIRAETMTMRCIICGHYETCAGTTTVTLEREGAVIVLRKVPAQVCPNCGEAYVGEAEAAAALERASRAAAEGVMVEVRDFVPAG